MWRSVRIIEGFGNTVGRFVAWAGLIMVLQQVMIIFLQRIFRVSEISFGPFCAFWVRVVGQVHAGVLRPQLVVRGTEALQRHGGHARLRLHVHSGRARPGGPGLFRRQLRQEKADRHVRVAFPDDAVADPDLALCLVLPVAASGDAEGIGDRQAGLDAEEGHDPALERRDDRVFAERFQRLLPVQGPAGRVSSR